MPGEHALLSFSASPRWLECSGSLHYDATMPDGPSSAAADRGTRIHEAAAAWLITGLIPTALKEPEDIGWASAYVSYVNSLAASLGDETRVLVEQKVALSGLAWGTADAIILSPYRMDIIDLKTGQQRVGADSPQLALYALAALREFNVLPSPIRHRTMPVEVRLHIFQPSLDWVDTKVLRVDGPVFKGLHAQVALTEAIVQAKTFEFNPSESTCNWCRGKNVCAARADRMHQIALKDFEVVKPTDLTIADYQRLLPHLGAVIKWCEEVKEYCTGLVASGVELPGFKLVAGQSKRQWADAEAAIDALTSAGLPLQVASKTTPIGIGDAEKLLGKKHAIFAEQTTKTAGKPTIVPASDPRPAIVGELGFD